MATVSVPVETVAALLAQFRVLARDAAQAEVARPDAGDRIGDGGRDALHARERVESRNLQQGYAALRLHLGRDEQHLAKAERHEQRESPAIDHARRPRDGRSALDPAGRPP
jgi:hypothetical protein